MKRKILWGIMSVALGGCVTRNIMLVHPNSGDIRQCQSAGAGIIPAVMAANMASDCVTQFEALGYVRADKLTPEQRAALNPKPRPIEADITVKQR
jgi:hypothetical protein